MGQGLTETVLRARRLRDSRRNREAHALLTEALKDAEATIGQGHPAVVDGILQLAWVCFGMGDVEGAGSWFREARGRVSKFSPIWMAGAIYHEALFHHRLGKREECDRLLVTGAGIIQESVPRDSEVALLLFKAVIRILVQLGRRHLVRTFAKLGAETEMVLQVRSSEGAAQTCCNPAIQFVALQLDELAHRTEDSRLL